MREIKFRGYALEELIDSQWVNDGFGVSKVEYSDGTYSIYLITSHGEYIVDEKSVGQYTGLKDINGKEIYEGDIVEERYINPLTKDTIVKKFLIKYRKDCFIAESIGHSPFGGMWLSFIKEGKVIGNMYQNKMR